MLIGIGIDAVEITRFKEWHLFSHTKLRRIFSAAEIEYCLSVPAKSAERFAVRFAAREAFFKAIGTTNQKKVLFLTLCRHIQVHKEKNGMPILVFEPEFFGLPADVRALISLTHTATTAVAMVVLEG